MSLFLHGFDLMEEKRDLGRGPCADSCPSWQGWVTSPGVEPLAVAALSSG